MTIRSLKILIIICLIGPFTLAQNPAFKGEISEGKNPWTSLDFHNNPDNFQFAIVSDRTGGHRDGIFGKAVNKLNLLMPEFVMSVGDLIEGYTKDSLEVLHQWQEFDSILSPLEVPFFFLPGNHDISNSMMRNQWKDRFGRANYHFIYKDVLFVTLDTNDGDGVMLGEEQLASVLSALSDNPDVRWTFLFMHHPIWNYRSMNGFDKVEEALKGRAYTVIAGHNHRYLQTERSGSNYYILGTTGGGSQLNGPRFGQFDHVTWVSMTDNGPKMVNLSLDGIIEHDVSNTTDLPMARSLMRAVQFRSLVLTRESSLAQRSLETVPMIEDAKVLLMLENTSEKEMYFKGRFYHHHQLEMDHSSFDLRIAPKSRQQLEILLTGRQLLNTEELDPLEMDWEMGFETYKVELPFSLKGTYAIEIDNKTDLLSFTEEDIFLDEHEIALNCDFEDLEIRYTFSDREPHANSFLYQAPLVATEDMTITAKVYDQEGRSSSALTREYHKVGLKTGVSKVKRAKSGLKYSYYEGQFEKLPDFDTLTSVMQGISENFDVDELSQRENHYAFLFEGYLEILVDGIYTFYLKSDDGSKFLIGDKLVVDNDGSHSSRTRKGMIALKKGMHPVRIEYFEDFMGQNLNLSYEGKGLSRREIPWSQFIHSK